MTDQEAIREFGLPATDEHREVIRALLQKEIQKQAEDDEDPELLRCLVVLLFSLGNAEDSMLIWEAKSNNFDSMCSLDIQLLCGAGVDATRKHLLNLDTMDSKAALSRLDSCLASGDFRNWTPELWVRYYRCYFGLDSELPPELQ